MILGTVLTFSSMVAKGLNIKVKKFWGSFPTFREVIWEKLVEGVFAPIQNSVKQTFKLLLTFWTENCYFFRQKDKKESLQSSTLQILKRLTLSCRYSSYVVDYSVGIRNYKKINFHLLIVNYFYQNKDFHV